MVKTLPERVNKNRRVDKTFRERRHPKQDRSLKTYNDLLDAAERLLKDRPWEDISTVAIMIEAGCSNGAIYGRFKNKDEMLVALYERHDKNLRKRFSKRKKITRADGQTLEEFVDTQIGQLIKNYRENRWLLREMGLLTRRKPEILSAEKKLARKDVLDIIAAEFFEFETEFNERVSKRDVELAIFFAATILRESILYPGPHHDTLNLSDEELKESVVKMTLRFLGNKLQKGVS